MVPVLLMYVSAVSASMQSSSVQQAMHIGQSSAILVLRADLWKADEAVSKLSRMSLECLGLLQNYLKVISDADARQAEPIEDVYDSLARMNIHDYKLSELADHAAYVSRLLHSACIKAAQPLLAELDKDRQLAMDSLAVIEDIFNPTRSPSLRLSGDKLDCLKASMATWRLKTLARKCREIINSSLVSWHVGPTEIVTLSRELANVVGDANRALAEFLCCFPACSVPMPKEDVVKPVKILSPRPVRGDFFRSLVEDKSPSPRVTEAIVIRPSRMSRCPVNLGTGPNQLARPQISPTSAFHALNEVVSRKSSEALTPAPRGSSEGVLTPEEWQFIIALKATDPSSLDCPDMKVWKIFNSLRLQNSHIASAAISEAARLFLRDTGLVFSLHEALELAEAYVMAESPCAVFYYELAHVVMTDVLGTSELPINLADVNEATELLGSLSRHLHQI